MEQKILPFKIEVEGIEEFQEQLNKIEKSLDRIIEKYEKIQVLGNN